MKSVVKSMEFIPKTTTGTPLRTPIPAISYFDILRFKREN